MNEEDILKQLQEYFFRNRDTVQRQYDPNQGKVWTDSYSLPQLMEAMGQNSAQQQYSGPSNVDEHNQRTLERLMQQRNKRYSM